MTSVSVFRASCGNKHHFRSPSQLIYGSTVMAAVTWPNWQPLHYSMVFEQWPRCWLHGKVSLLRFSVMTDYINLCRVTQTAAVW